MDFKKFVLNTFNRAIAKKKTKGLKSTHLAKPLFLAIIILPFFPLSSLAQPSPRPVAPREPRIPQPLITPPRPRPIPEVEPLPDPQDLLPPLRIPSDRPTPPFIQEPLQQISVKQFSVLGSTVFSETELAEVLKPFTNRTLTFTELLAAQDAVSRLYLEKGYITSGAFIPPQEIRDGIVKIQVIEGKIKDLNITGLDRLNSEYVRSRVVLGTKTPFNRDDLLLALQLLQLDPLIERLSAELASEASPGISNLNIDVEEADAFELELSTDNRRSPSLGSVRGILNVRHINLIGIGDRFEFSYYKTEGTDALDNLRYTIPVNPRNGTVTLAHNRTKNEIVEEPFNLLDIESDSREYELSFRQPLYQTPNTEFSLGLIGSRRESQNFLAGEPSRKINREADEEGRIKISALRFSQEYVKRDRQQVFALFSLLSLGIDAFDATDNKDIIDIPNNRLLPDSQFFSWRGQAQYLRLLSEQAPHPALLFRADLQLSNDSLLPQEQFSIGGQQSVRGYRQDALLGDKGFFASVELRTPIFYSAQKNITLELIPFIDYGRVWNDISTETFNEIIGLEITRSQLASFGFGLRFLLRDDFDMRVDLGIPIESLDGPKRTLQEKGVYFQVRYRPF